MAKSDSNSDTDEAAAAAAAKKKKMTIIAGVVLAAAAYKFVLAPSPTPEEVLPVDEGVARIIEEGEVLAVPELIINLADEDQLRYLRVGVAVILEIGVASADVEPKLPIVNDVVVDVMSGKTLAELRAPGAKAEAKVELSERVREAFDDMLVARIIFTSFVMQ
jgi:flagellar FliL protein